jgi:hypothetical protein
VPEHLQLANVGSSHGECSFDYTDTPYPAFNLGLTAQRHMYNYAVLKQYIGCFEPGATLLIPISYFEITRIKLDYLDQRARYYFFLEDQYMDTFSFSEKLLFTYAPLLNAGSTLPVLIKDTTPPLQKETMPEDELHKVCDERWKFWNTDTAFGIEAGEEGFIYNKEWVCRIIDLCLAHNIHPVLISTPITSILNEIYDERSPAFFDTFYRFTRELREAYPYVPYLDYSHDPRFTHDFSLFMDGDHLNASGAKKFTAIVIADLQARLK